jgi:Trk K+ transport system NAD-binding subunit
MVRRRRISPRSSMPLLGEYLQELSRHKRASSIAAIFRSGVAVAAAPDDNIRGSTDHCIGQRRGFGE